MKRVPTSYVAALGALLAIAVVATLMYLSVPPFDNISLFIVTNAGSFMVLMIAGVVGGAFVGMLIAQRMLGNREFSPFERDVLRTLADIRDRLERLEKEHDEPKIRR